VGSAAQTTRSDTESCRNHGVVSRQRSDLDLDFVPLAATLPKLLELGLMSRSGERQVPANTVRCRHASSPVSSTAAITSV
jgi:hypothetical protein